MIDRQHNCILIECDTCEDVFTGMKGEQFVEVWERAQAEGWWAKKIETKSGHARFEHTCPVCWEG